MHFFIAVFILMTSLSAAQIEIGRGTAKPNVNDWGEGTKLKIGNFCSIASDAWILMGGEHHTEWVTTYALFYDLLTPTGFKFSKTKGDIVIGNDVWIGSGACILSGVTIGDGAVIGARTVVAKDIPPYAIAVGNPARVIKYRFDSETIEKLLKIQWWNWSDEEIKEIAPLLLSPHIEQFIEYCQQHHPFLYTS